MDKSEGNIEVEFFGIARWKAKTERVSMAAGSLRNVLRNAMIRQPGLNDLLQENGEISKHYLLSLNGERFLESLDDTLSPGDHLLILSADAGGA